MTSRLAAMDSALRRTFRPINAGSAMDGGSLR
jgi:hypothetical protein